MAKGAKRVQTDTAAPYLPADPQDIMAALPGTPSDDEIAERLTRQTKARLKESRQLLDAAKQKLRNTPERAAARISLDRRS